MMGKQISHQNVNAPYQWVAYRFLTAPLLNGTALSHPSPRP